MNEGKLERYISIAIEGALIGREEILRQYGRKQEVFSKGGVDGYTSTDQELEEKTRTYLKKETGIDVYGEEKGGNESLELLWVIDKIDGTPNFRSGVPLFGSAVSLLKENECLITAIFLPILNELYSGCKTLGSYKWINSSKEKLQVSLETDIRHVQIATDLSYSGREEKLRKMSRYASLPFYCPIYGSASYSMCKVADGSFSGYVIFDVNINDIFTGPLLISEAGGIVSDNKGKAITRETRTLVAASNKEIHRRLLDTLKNEH